MKFSKRTIIEAGIGVVAVAGIVVLSLTAINQNTQIHSLKGDVRSLKSDLSNSRSVAQNCEDSSAAWLLVSQDEADYIDELSNQVGNIFSDDFSTAKLDSVGVSLSADIAAAKAINCVASGDAA